MPNLCAVLLALLTFTSASPRPIPVRFSWEEARRLQESLHPRSLKELGAAFERAQASGDWPEAARSAAELCTLGSADVRACRLAEKSAGNLRPRAQLLVSPGNPR